MTTEKLFREASQAHIYNLSIELNAKSAWSHLISQINARKITCQQAIELINKDALQFKEAFASGFIGSKNNPIRSTRILVLDSNKSMLAGTLTKNLTKDDTKSFSPSGLPPHIVSGPIEKELWLPGGKVDRIGQGWESWPTAACRELMEETGLQAKERDLCELNTQAFRLLKYKGKFYWLKFFIFHSKAATVTPNEEFAALNWHDIQWEATHTTEEEMKSWNCVECCDFYVYFAGSQKFSLV